MGLGLFQSAKGLTRRKAESELATLKAFTGANSRHLSSTKSSSTASPFPGGCWAGSMGKCDAWMTTAPQWPTEKVLHSFDSENKGRAATPGTSAWHRKGGRLVYYSGALALAVVASLTNEMHISSANSC